MLILLLKAIISVEEDYSAGDPSTKLIAILDIYEEWAASGLESTLVKWSANI